MGTALLRGCMAGALEKPKPGGAYRVTIWRGQELEPRKPPGFSRFGNEPPEYGEEPPHVCEECAVANDFQQEAKHIKNCYQLMCYKYNK